jgi:hypothetical protein
MRESIILKRNGKSQIVKHTQSFRFVPRQWWLDDFTFRVFKSRCARSNRIQYAMALRSGNEQAPDMPHRAFRFPKNCLSVRCRWFARFVTPSRKHDRIAESGRFAQPHLARIAAFPRADS